MHGKEEERAVLVISLSILTNGLLFWLSVHIDSRQRELQETCGKFSSAQI